MTSKETIKEFEHLLKVEKDRIHKDVVFITALENAIEALEKQIPQKVISNGYVYFCPECRGSVWQIKCESKYCFRCGQALDWSSENE